MFNQYQSADAAKNAVDANGFGPLDLVFEPMLGGGVQPVLICDHIRDAEIVQRSGFNARLRVEYAAD
ncbi:MAG: hypothetical protein EOO77_31130 [Oxalobacteraceae bacterium]|jgi:hypothetical protein|nr:MAG: hypothetical protein EOO77_31130 [Oxalobacteraceae bacterium]